MFLPARITLFLVALTGNGLCLAQSGVSVEPSAATTDKQLGELQPHWLRVTADRVNLRSRPDRNSVVVARVDQDQVLQGIDCQFGWCRVQPPAGVFSYVSARYIDQLTPAEGVVSVRSGNLRVRVGSLLTELDPLKSEVQTLLPRGTDVRIVGQQSDWLKIAPPSGVYLYISDDFVEHVSPEVASQLQAATFVISQPTTAAAQTQAAPTIDLSGKWGQRLVLVEAAIDAQSRQPVLEQSWKPALTQLRPIAEQREEPIVARLAQQWVVRVEERLANQATLQAARKITRHEDRNRTRFEQELEKIRRVRSEPNAGSGFLARGQMLASFALRDAAREPQYKLENPLTRRIVAYLQFPSTTKIRPRNFLGQYVGVQGTQKFDHSLGTRVIEVKKIEILKREIPASQPVRKNP